MSDGFQFASLGGFELDDEQFRRLRNLVYGVCGLNLTENKKALVRGRLSRRIRELGLGGFAEYLSYVEADRSGEELTAMLDALTTNVTNFFREKHHFDWLRDHVIEPMKTARAGIARTKSGTAGIVSGRRLRIWSAGCSTGEEPYSIAMTICESVGDLRGWDAKILATDISTKALSVARRGIYSRDRVRDVPPELIRRYFDAPDPNHVAVKPALKRLISFARLNLMDRWPMRGPFDVIFCRNVMIYFDKKTQQELVGRFWNLLKPDGYLFLGHSENLTGVAHSFATMRPTVYRKLQPRAA